MISPLCHRPLYAGDPIFFLQKQKWAARTVHSDSVRTAMTPFGFWGK
jgi:hypothetical protein